MWKDGYLFSQGVEKSKYNYKCEIDNIIEYTLNICLGDTIFCIFDPGIFFNIFPKIHK